MTWIAAFVRTSCHVVAWQPGGQKGVSRRQTRLQLVLLHVYTTFYDFQDRQSYPRRSNPYCYSSSLHASLHSNDNMFTIRIAYTIFASISVVLAGIDAPPTLTSPGRGLLSDEPLTRLKRQSNAPCRPGQYYTTKCKACTAGYSCPDGQNRNPCGAGAYSGPSATQCTLCPKGTFSNSTYRLSVSMLLPTLQQSRPQSTLPAARPLRPVIVRTTP